MIRPIATSQETIEALLKRAVRKATPIRRDFVWQGRRGKRRPGPLADFVRRRDLRALLLYLLFRGVASKEPWDSRISAKVWARALDMGATNEAVAGVSKVWGRLVERRLVARKRDRRQARVFALQEDGSGEVYSHPGIDQKGEAYFQLPHAFWTAAEQWHRKLDLAELAMLLIALSLPDEFTLVYERAPKQFGISADTAQRGLKGLQQKGLLKMRKVFKPAPLAPDGYTEERRYTLQPPFRRRKAAPEAAA
jgi:hypothetical protein